MTSDQLITRIANDTGAAYREAINLAHIMLTTGNLSDAERVAVEAALVARGEQIATGTNDLINEVNDVLKYHGVDYQMTDWLTPSNYAERYGIHPSTVSAWVKRGIIPADHVKEITEWGIRLIKNVPYEARPYNKGGKDAEV